jgi:ABC-type sulfate transport system permease subunit
MPKRGGGREARLERRRRDDVRVRMREIEARTAWQVPLAWGFVGVVVLIPIVWIIANTIADLGSSLAGKDTQADVNISVNLAIAATISVTVVGLGMAWKIRSQKRRLRAQRDQLDELEAQLDARDERIAELEKRPKKK